MVKVYRPEPSWPIDRSSSRDAFNRIMTLIAAGKDLSTVLDAIVRAVEAQDPRILCSILLLDETGERLAHGAAPNLPEAYNQAIAGTPIGPKAGSCGTALYLRQRVIVETIATDPLWDDYRHLAAAAGLESCWSQPIFAEGEALGSFAIYQGQPSKPSTEDIAFIETAADLAAIAIGRHRADARLALSQVREQSAAAARQEAARNLKSFFDMSLDMLCIASLDGELIELSQCWEETLGYPIETLKGQSFLPLIHPDDLEPTREAMQQLWRDDEVRGFVNRYRRSDGVYRTLEWRTRRSGDLTFAVARDVTDRQAVEAQMAAARAAAEAANQAKSDFLANVSHEIRTPLNGVIGVTTALSRTALTSDQRAMVDLIQTSGESLERLVSDILDVTSIEGGRLVLQSRTFDLDHALRGSLDMHRLEAEASDLAFEVCFGPGAHGGFVGDDIRIRQVLDNLLSNAVKFTRQGRVAVDIQVLDGDPTRLVIEVADTGIGFDAAMADRLFERFNQGDASVTRAFGGTGLGLSISRAIVDMMGGELTAESAPGRGSRFRAVIPLARGSDVGQAAADQAPPLFGDRPLRVLLAEDHPTNQKVVDLILGPYDAHLKIVENGALAVEAFKDAPYDVVLMDIQMPVMDGLTAIQAIRGFEAARGDRGRTPIVALSANAMTHHREEAVAAGADLHVAKPVTAAALLAGIHQVLAEVVA
jgi:PAS domain S-box-containing protein